jgi:hypothetical protein
MNVNRLCLGFLNYETGVKPVPQRTSIRQPPVVDLYGLVRAGRI